MTSPSRLPSRTRRRSLFARRPSPMPTPSSRFAPSCSSPRTENQAPRNTPGKEPAGRSSSRAAAGDLVGAVAETGDGSIVASGIATLRRWLPSPTNPSGLTGYIGSMATVDEWRCRGIGGRVIEALIAMLTEHGAVDIDVHVTEAGEGVYRSLGFAEPDAGTELTLHTNSG